MKDLGEKHKRIVSQYDQEKSKHLEKLANQMLKNEEKADKLKGKAISNKFWDLF
jgi:hypothetical protein